MKWNLRLAAAQRGIWTASELQRMLADRGLVISAGKMSGLWSGQPASIKLSDLEVLCAVLDATPDELLLREPHTVPAAASTATVDQQAATGAATGPRPASAVRPRRPGQRTLPPAP
jgi:DNA-binding Xre family transcriptional regulator